MKSVIYSLILVVCFASSAFAGEPYQCGKKTHKLKICHFEKGTERYKDLCIGLTSIWGHMSQHDEDYFGECKPYVCEESSPYICNAGIKHEPHSEDLCQNRISGENGSHGEVCSPATSSLHAFDYVKAEVATIPSNMTPIEPYEHRDQLRFLSKLVFATDGTNGYGQLSDDPTKSVLNDNETLSFHLGSERIGAEYFVDVCWDNPAPQADGAYNLKAKYSEASSLFSGRGYLAMANVASKFSVYCDSDRSASDIQIPLIPDYETSFESFISGQTSYDYQLFDEKFCVFRFTLKENEGDALRDWTFKNVSILSELNLSCEDDGRYNGTIEICHVWPIGRNQYACQVNRYETADDYVDYLKTFSNVQSYLNVHQYDYSGPCQHGCDFLD